MDIRVLKIVLHIFNRPVIALMSILQLFLDTFVRFSFFFKREVIIISLLTHSHTMTPFDAPGKQAF